MEKIKFFILCFSFISVFSLSGTASAEAAGDSGEDISPVSSEGSSGEGDTVTASAEAGHSSGEDTPSTGVSPKVSSGEAGAAVAGSGGDMSPVSSEGSSGEGVAVTGSGEEGAVSSDGESKRAYPEDQWIKSVLNDEFNNSDVLKYLSDILLDPKTSEAVWEDAFQVFMIHSKNPEDMSVRNQVHLTLNEVAYDPNRTQGQKYDSLMALRDCSTDLSATLLKDFILSETPESLIHGEGLSLKWDALKFLEDSQAPSSVKALEDVVLTQSVPKPLREKSLESLKDREAYDRIFQLTVNPLLEMELRWKSFYILVQAEEDDLIKEVVLTPSAGEAMHYTAIGVLEAGSAIKHLYEISANLFVSDPVRETAFLKYLKVTGSES